MQGQAAMDALPLLGALAAGLLGSPHCAAMCGGIHAAAAGERGGALAWHLGRLATYAALGALVGASGTALPSSALGAGFAAVLVVVFALKLAGVGPKVPVPAFYGRIGGRLLRLGGPSGRLLLGALTGLLPCGLVWAALALPLVSGGALPGALALLAFGAGTLPALGLSGIILRKLAGGTALRRRLVAAAVGVAGLATIGFRSGVFSHPPPESGEHGPACHAH